MGMMVWSTAQVQNWPALPPQKRAPPACSIFNLTQRCLPSFMVIGTQKSGTSSLFNIMAMHPRIKPAEKKELLWFNGNFENLRCNPPDKAPGPNDFKAYLDNFPALKPGTTQLTGEFSATYMHCWCCPQSMSRLMPGLRLITQLRDPIERARSRWTEQHSWAKKLETFGSFEEYVEKELPRLETCLQKAAGWLEYEVHCAADSNILGLSVYNSAIKLWLHHHESKNLLVTYLEQFSSNPQSVATAIHMHLGIEDILYDDRLLQKKYNAEGNYGWSKSALQTIQLGNTTSLQKLYQFYRPQMAELKSMADAGQIAPLPTSWIVRWSL